MKKQIAIYGGGGLGREMLSLLKALPEWEIIGFYDDNFAQGTQIRGLPVLGGLPELLTTDKQMNLIVAIGDPGIKRKVTSSLKDKATIDYPVIIHPQAIIQDIDTVLLGKGTVITAGVVLTNDIRLDEHVLLNLNCTIGHDVNIGACSSLMPGANIAGGVNIGECVLIGSGANILNGLHIGDGVRVGSGSVVTKNVLQNQTVVGVPAALVSENKKR